MASTGELSFQGADDLKAIIQSEKVSGQAIKAEAITQLVRSCGICKQPGLTRLKCPSS